MRKTTCNDNIVTSWVSLQSSRFKHSKVITSILYYIRTRFCIILHQLGIVNIYTQQFRGQLKISLTKIIIGNLVSKLKIFIYFLDRYALSLILCIIDISTIPLNYICVMFFQSNLKFGAVFFTWRLFPLIFQDHFSKLLKY